MICTKSEFLRLYAAGKLGNKLQNWLTLEAALGSGHTGLFSARDGRPNSNLSRYLIPRDRLTAETADMTALGADGVYYNEAAPDDRLTIQGEYQDRYLMWSTEQTQMKRVRSWNHSEGSASLAILRSYLNDNSWDDFQILREVYPGHIIEFGSYECFVGNLPGRNTIIWEVRSF